MSQFCPKTENWQLLHVMGIPLDYAPVWNVQSLSDKNCWKLQYVVNHILDCREGEFYDFNEEGNFCDKNSWKLIK